MTHKEKILRYMRRYKQKGITQLDALRLFGCMRLASRIRELIKEGYLISSEMVKVKNADGSYSHVACYKLIKEKTNVST